ncbi:L-methionine/branched-chain amino acid transporter [Shewanella sp. D64]|uniref:L-methionine/branched-chain amino acid transporter n=1 Tax=unclassified Shewanella TaxID=196818 RepID=UPI0022BA61B5|nr:MULTISPECIES: L-methionine/branched-chain amino acid transporter [unclassified Shewanella]MEC4728655.1 L-methionine/branched-chain amino acid transporter [Shewanella sp. D64]MEC4740582.1 L-methionine/branched-chain amino acid transporter [Shewanella sp. E94]WBJ95109.1 L-methionine/branched-chain amino acid transporter [Shewanella sp. MTB7]
MNSSVKGTIGRWQGAGLMATTLLGTGVFILPQMTIKAAGSGALIAWLILTLAIIPVTLVFGRLASVFPHAAGPAYFVEKAFGRTSGRTIGLLFLLVVPLGAPAAIMMTFKFVNALVALSGWAEVATEILLLSLLFVLNFKGVQVSAKLQFALTLAIVSVMVVLYGAAGMNLSEMESVATGVNPDVNLIMVAASIAFWSFLGIEAMTHLANDFRDPKRDMIPAMIIGTVLVGLVYLACTFLLLMLPTSAGVAMVGVFDALLGGYGAQVVGVLGIASGLATVNIYTASASRLVWSFSREGLLPRYFNHLNRHRVPVRASGVILAIMAVVIVLTYATGQDLEHLIAWTNGVFVIIYFVSMLAAIKLLRKRFLPLIVLSCALCLLLGFALGMNMAYALLLTASLYPLLWWQKVLLSRRKVCQTS